MRQVAAEADDRSTRQQEQKHTRPGTGIMRIGEQQSLVHQQPLFFWLLLFISFPFRRNGVSLMRPACSLISLLSLLYMYTVDGVSTINRRRRRRRRLVPFLLWDDDPGTLSSEPIDVYTLHLDEPDQLIASHINNRGPPLELFLGRSQC